MPNFALSFFFSDITPVSSSEPDRHFSTFVSGLTAIFRYCTSFLLLDDSQIFFSLLSNHISMTCASARLSDTPWLSLSPWRRNMSLTWSQWRSCRRRPGRGCTPSPPPPCTKTQCSLNTPERSEYEREMNVKWSDIASCCDYMIGSIWEGALLVVIAIVWSTETR